MQIKKINLLPVMSTKNKQTASSFDELTLLYRRFMQLIAIRPFDASGYTCLATRLLLAFFFTMSLIAWTSFVSYLLTGGAVTIETICEMIIVMGYNARYYLLLWHRRELTSLLEGCRRIWQELCSTDEDACNSVRHFERKVRLMFYGLFGSFTCSNVAYFSTTLSLTLEAARKANDSQDKEYYLPFEWFVEDAENFWPGYKFNYAVELIVGVNAIFISTSVDTTAPLLIMIGAGYFRALRLRLCRLYGGTLENDNDNAMFADRELVACLRLHQSILGYCSRIDNITRNLFLVQLMTTTYNISLVGIKLAGADPDRYKYAPVAVLSVGQLFICHWAPDHLLDESTSISTATYDAFVPGMSSRKGKVLRLMITRAQQPVQMTAAGFVHLSLRKFGEMLQGAFSFFMVLRRLAV